MLTRRIATEIAAKCNGAYVIDLNVVESNYYRLLNAFKRLWANTTIAYSYKTNYNRAICQTLHKAGAKAEVVSMFEYQYAKSNRIADEDIVFNGLIKHPDTSALIALKGGIVNVDNLRELEELEEYAKRHEVRLNIGLRLDPCFNDTVDSRFGIRVGSDDYRKAKNLLMASEHLICVGVHSHYKRRSLEDYKARVEGLIEASKELHATDFIDIGSGVFSEMPEGFGDRFGDRPTFEQYAEVACNTLKEHGVSKSTKLILEFGLPIVANAVSYVTHVADIKTDKNVNRVQTYCSKFLVISPALFGNLPVIVYGNSDSTAPAEDYALVGFTCVEEDLLAKYHGRIDIGDIIVFGNVGAYTQSFAPNFILPEPPTYAVKGNDFWLVKRSTALHDILCKYVNDKEGAIW